MLDLYDVHNSTFADATISFASSGPFSANEGDVIVIPMILEGVQTLVSIDVGLSGVSDSAGMFNNT